MIRTSSEFTNPNRREFLLSSAGLMLGAGVGLPGAALLAGQSPAPRMRRVWLRLLLTQVEDNLRAGKKLTEQERYFAGLSSVRYIYLDEERRDLILEGPAENEWEVRPDGIVVGTPSGVPILQLDDLAVAWRNANDGSPPPSVSLEHRQESVRRIQEMIRNTLQPTTAAARAEYTRRLQEAWGLQDAVTGGVPTNTRFNKVMVDADWEMKRISLGLSDPEVEKFPTYVDLEFNDLRRRVLSDGVNARKSDGGSRFWFFPAYKEFAHSEKLDAVAIPQDPVQLLTESHFRNIAQGRAIAQEPSPAAKEFVREFTKNYAAIAAKNPIYADLRNLFDWVAVVRLMRLLDAPKRIGWDLGFLRQGYPVAELQVSGTMPGQVAIRHAEVKTKQGLASVVFPAWGGVSMDLFESIRTAEFHVDPRLEARFRSAVRARPWQQSFWR